MTASQITTVVPQENIQLLLTVIIAITIGQYHPKFVFIIREFHPKKRNIRFSQNVHHRIK